MSEEQSQINSCTNLLASNPGEISSDAQTVKPQQDVNTSDFLQRMKDEQEAEIIMGIGKCGLTNHQRLTKTIGLLVPRYDERPGVLTEKNVNRKIKLKSLCEENDNCQLDNLHYPITQEYPVFMTQRTTKVLAKTIKKMKGEDCVNADRYARAILRFEDPRNTNPQERVKESIAKCIGMWERSYEPGFLEQYNGRCFGCPECTDSKKAILERDAYDVVVATDKINYLVTQYANVRPVLVHRAMMLHAYLIKHPDQDEFYLMEAVIMFIKFPQGNDNGIRKLMHWILCNDRTLSFKKPLTLQMYESFLKVTHKPGFESLRILVHLECSPVPDTTIDQKQSTLLLYTQFVFSPYCISYFREHNIEYIVTYQRSIELYVVCAFIDYVKHNPHFRLVGLYSTIECMKHYLIIAFEIFRMKIQRQPGHDQDRESSKPGRDLVSDDTRKKARDVLEVITAEELSEKMLKKFEEVFSEITTQPVHFDDDDNTMIEDVRQNEVYGANRLFPTRNKCFAVQRFMRDYLNDDFGQRLHGIATHRHEMQRLILSAFDKFSLPSYAVNLFSGYFRDAYTVVNNLSSPSQKNHRFIHRLLMIDRDVPPHKDRVLDNLKDMTCQSTIEFKKAPISSENIIDLIETQDGSKPDLVFGVWGLGYLKDHRALVQRLIDAKISFFFIEHSKVTQDTIDLGYKFIVDVKNIPNVTVLEKSIDYVGHEDNVFREDSSIILFDAQSLVARERKLQEQRNAESSEAFSESMDEEILDLEDLSTKEQVKRCIEFIEQLVGNFNNGEGFNFIEFEEAEEIEQFTGVVMLVIKETHIPAFRKAICNLRSLTAEILDNSEMKHQFFAFLQGTEVNNFIFTYALQIDAGQRRRSDHQNIVKGIKRSSFMQDLIAEVTFDCRIPNIAMVLLTTTQLSITEYNDLDEDFKYWMTSSIRKLNMGSLLEQLYTYDYYQSQVQEVDPVRNAIVDFNIEVKKLVLKDIRKLDDQVIISDSFQQLLRGNEREISFKRVTDCVKATQNYIFGQMMNKHIDEVKPNIEKTSKVEIPPITPEDKRQLIVGIKQSVPDTKKNPYTEVIEKTISICETQLKEKGITLQDTIPVDLINEQLSKQTVIEDILQIGCAELMFDSIFKLPFAMTNAMMFGRNILQSAKQMKESTYTQRGILNYGTPDSGKSVAIGMFKYWLNDQVSFPSEYSQYDNIIKIQDHNIKNCGILSKDEITSSMLAKLIVMETLKSFCDPAASTKGRMLFGNAIDFGLNKSCIISSNVDPESIKVCIDKMGKQGYMLTDSVATSYSKRLNVNCITTCFMPEWFEMNSRKAYPVLSKGQYLKHTVPEKFKDKHEIATYNAWLALAIKFEGIENVKQNLSSKSRNTVDLIIDQFDKTLFGQIFNRQQDLESIIRFFDGEACAITQMLFGFLQFQVPAGVQTYDITNLYETQKLLWKNFKDKFPELVDDLERTQKKLFDLPESLKKIQIYSQVTPMHFEQLNKLLKDNVKRELDRLGKKRNMPVFFTTLSQESSNVQKKGDLIIKDIEEGVQNTSILDLLADCCELDGPMRQLGNRNDSNYGVKGNTKGSIKVRELKIKYKNKGLFK